MFLELVLNFGVQGLSLGLRPDSRGACIHLYHAFRLGSDRVGPLARSYLLILDSYLLSVR